MTDELKYKPTGHSYRVDERVWAGEYPVWEWGRAAGMQQLELYTAFGIDHFVDLTEEGEMPPYAALLTDKAERYSFPISNGGVPSSVRSVVELFRGIEDVLTSRQGARLYIHCVGGAGRTGTIVACYYVYFGAMSADEALAWMRSRFTTHGGSAWMSAPETPVQEEFVREFADKYRDYK